MTDADPESDPTVASTDPTSEVDVDPSEVERLRAERDALAAQVATLEAPHGGRLRRVAVGVLVVISWLALALAPVAVWAKSTLVETDRWVEIAGPLVDEPAVQDALATWATDELVTLVQPQEVLADALPDRASVLAAPLANAVTGFVREKVLELIQSPEFAEIWETAVARAHEAALRLLRDDAPNVEATSDSVTINLVPLLQQVLDRITAASPELFGREIDIPDIDLANIPDDAAQRLGDAFGVEVPEDFGQFTVYDDGRLKAAQDALRLASDLVVLIVILAVVAPLAAIALSRKRLGTASLVLLGGLVGLVLIRRGLYLLVETVLDEVRVPERRGAVDRLLERLLDPLFDATAWLVGGAAALVVVLYLVSSRPGAVRIRRAVPRAAHRVLVAAQANQGVAQVLVIAAGLLVLWTTDLAWLTTLLFVGLVGAVAWAIGQLPDPDAPSDVPGSVDPGP